MKTEKFTDLHLRRNVQSAFGVDLFDGCGNPCFLKLNWYVIQMGRAILMEGNYEVDVYMPEKFIDKILSRLSNYGKLTVGNKTYYVADIHRKFSLEELNKKDS